jgi:hypothetical protein
MARALREAQALSPMGRVLREQQGEIWKSRKPCEQLRKQLLRLSERLALHQPDLCLTWHQEYRLKEK